MSESIRKNLLELPIISDVNKSSGKYEAQGVTIRFNDLEDMGELTENYLVNIVWEGEVRRLGENEDV